MCLSFAAVLETGSGDGPGYTRCRAIPLIARKSAAIGDSTRSEIFLLRPAFPPLCNGSS